MDSEQSLCCECKSLVKWDLDAENSIYSCTECDKERCGNCGSAHNYKCCKCGYLTEWDLDKERGVYSCTDCNVDRCGSCGPTHKYRCCECKCLTNWKYEEDEDTYTCDECLIERCEDCGPLRDCCQSRTLTQHSTCSPDCTSCKEYDPEDEESSKEESDYESEDDPALYYRKDTEAKKHASIPINELLEAGPKEEDLVLLMVTPEARKTALRVSPEIMSSIYALYFAEYLATGRTIRVIPNGPDTWTYRSFAPPNQIPFIIHGLNGLMKKHALKTLKKAPRLGSKYSYPYFNYGVDVLFFDFRSCGTTDAAFAEYIGAMRSAGKHLRNHNKKHHNRVIKAIKVTYCCHVEFVQNVLDCFRNIPKLKHVTLKAHKHWDHIEDHVLLGELKLKEASEMHFSVRSGDLKGSYHGGERQKYQFKAELFNARGSKVDGTMYDSDDEENWQPASDYDSEPSDHKSPDTSFEEVEAAADVADASTVVEAKSNV